MKTTRFNNERGDGNWTPELLASHAWRRQPVVLRQAVPTQLLEKFDREKIKSVVSRLAYMRVFVSDPGAIADTAVSRLVPASHASSLLNRLLDSALKYTLLLNRVDAVDDDVVKVMEFFGVPHRWRSDDIVVTWSTSGSGIGYHAGHEDAIIVQALGRRHWRVWSADEVNKESRRRILISALGENNKIYRSSAEPLLDCELEPGDALYIPPFYPHEGMTLQDSVSIALGWRGVAYFHIVEALANSLLLPGGISSHSLPDAFFELVPDVDPDRLDESRSQVADGVVARLIELGCSIADPTSLSHRVRMALSTPIT